MSERQLQCTTAGCQSKTFQYVEDICSARKVIGFSDDGSLEIEAHYSTEGYDEAPESSRLVCEHGHTQPVPEDCDLEFL